MPLSPQGKTIVIKVQKRKIWRLNTVLRSDKEIEAEQDLNPSHLPIPHCLPLHEERADQDYLLFIISTLQNLFHDSLPPPSNGSAGKSKDVPVDQTKTKINKCQSTQIPASYSLQQKPVALKNQVRMEWEGQLEGAEMGPPRCRIQDAFFCLVLFCSSSVLLQCREREL